MATMMKMKKGDGPKKVAAATVKKSTGPVARKPSGKTITMKQTVVRPDLGGRPGGATSVRNVSYKDTLGAKRPASRVLEDKRGNVISGPKNKPRPKK